MMFVLKILLSLILVFDICLVITLYVRNNIYRLSSLEICIICAAKCLNPNEVEDNDREKFVPSNAIPFLENALMMLEEHNLHNDNCFYNYHGVLFESVTILHSSSDWIYSRKYIKSIEVLNSLVRMEHAYTENSYTNYFPILPKGLNRKLKRIEKRLPQYAMIV